MVAVSNNLIRMTDECGRFKVAISFDYAHMWINLLDTGEVLRYFADNAVIERMQNELSKMVNNGEARRSNAIGERVYYV